IQSVPWIEAADKADDPAFVSGPHGRSCEPGWIQLLRVGRIRDYRDLRLWNSVVVDQVSLEVRRHHGKGTRARENIAVDALRERRQQLVSPSHQRAAGSVVDLEDEWFSETLRDAGAGQPEDRIALVDGIDRVQFQASPRFAERAEVIGEFGEFERELRQRAAQ